MKSAGAGDIDLANATVQYQSDDVAETLSYSGTGTGANSFMVTPTDSDTAIGPSGDIVLNDTDDRLVITVSLSAVGDELTEGEEATVTFADQSGASTIYGVNVPDTISDETFVAV
jgi:archaellin